MTATNPHPLANPLTDRPIGNVNWGKYAAGSYFKAFTPSEAKTTRLPDTTIDYNEVIARQRELTVPNQEVPSIPSLGIQRCPDGTFRSVYDMNVMQLQPDVDRQQMLAAKDAELSVNMSDFQKDLLSKIDDEFVGHSKLIEESKKKEQTNGNQ